MTEETGSASADEQKKAEVAARMAHARSKRGKKSKPVKKAPVRDVVDERAEAQASFASEQQKQRKEPHFWITFHRMGESDQVRTVEIGAAGVRYIIPKGQRTPLPHSAIQALKLAVRVGLDHGHPIEINGRKYLRKVEESEYSYTIDANCSPEEALEWHEGQKRIAGKHADLVPQGPENTDDLVQVGTI